jgi:hypothetical protein
LTPQPQLKAQVGSQDSIEPGQAGLRNAHQLALRDGPAQESSQILITQLS